ncbi:hypothetical protein [Zooshikella sp. RANM57]|uniref:hypothetical protein n=1 Tax=Zooshikella sp. RANM57 TaxID=3425863 RepID=UPI003D6E5249
MILPLQKPLFKLPLSKVSITLIEHAVNPSLEAWLPRPAANSSMCVILLLFAAKKVLLGNTTGEPLIEIEI